MRSLFAERQRAINGIALVCIFLTLLVTGLRFLPPAFPHAAVIGDLVFSLAIAYLGAWFFNLLVIEIPKRRQQTEAFKIIDANLGELAALGFSMYTVLTEFSKTEPFPTPEVKESVVAAVGAYVKKMGRGIRKDSSLSRHVEWSKAYAAEKLAKDSDLILTYYGAELYVVAREITESRYFNYIRELTQNPKNDLIAKFCARELEEMIYKGSLLNERLNAARNEIRNREHDTPDTPNVRKILSLLVSARQRF